MRNRERDKKITFWFCFENTNRKHGDDTMLNTYREKGDEDEIAVQMLFVFLRLFFISSNYFFILA